MRKIITLMLSVAMICAVNAQTISPSVAAQKAASLFASASVSHAKGAIAAPQLAKVSTLGNDTCFYIFDNPNGGYAIIGGDAASKEVLATSTTGSFDYDKLPDAAKELLAEYAHEIAAAKAAGHMEVTAGTSHGKDIAPLCPVQWNQSSPWNQDIPTLPTNMPGKFIDDGEDVGGEKAAIGCVAVGAAEVLYSLSTKFSMPTNVKSDIKKVLNFVDADDNPLAKTPELTFLKSEKINWSDMTNQNGKSASRLMLLMGLVSNMGYGVESGALIDDLAKGLRSDLGLSCVYENKDDQADNTWETKIYNELSTGRPIIYGASSMYIGSGGHCFVIDGYEQKNNLFHVNWGWGGSGDDYFALTASSASPLTGDAAWGSRADTLSAGYGSWMLPGGQGVGATNGDYRDAHQMIYQIVFQPLVSATGATISSSSNAKSMMQTDTPVFVDINTDRMMTVTFDGEGAANTGNDINMVWGVELAPLNEDGSEVDDADGLLLAADDKKVEMFSAGTFKTSYTVDLSEYEWGTATDAIAFGKYSVIPCIFYDGDNDNDYVSDEQISYVQMPEGWQAPMVNFIEPTAVAEINAGDSASNAVRKVVTVHGIVISKDSKQYNAAGVQIK